jgi:hypothetical protein
MPVEIRELVVRTEVLSAARAHTSAVKEKDLTMLRRQIMEECRRMINERTSKNIYKR